MKLTKIIIIFFVLMGIFFSVILTEEVFHSIHMKGSTSICVITNFKIKDNLQSGFLMAFTTFKDSKYDNIEQYNNLRITSEKIASVIVIVLLILIPFLVGYWFRGYGNKK